MVRSFYLKQTNTFLCFDFIKSQKCYLSLNKKKNLENINLCAYFTIFSFKNNILFHQGVYKYELTQIIN